MGWGVSLFFYNDVIDNVPEILGSYAISFHKNIFSPLIFFSLVNSFIQIEKVHIVS